VNDTLPSLTDYPPNGTIFDQLDAHGVTWKDYYTDLATTELYPPLYLKNVGSKVVPIAGFFTDAAAGTLPGYCLVEANYSTQSEENPQNIAIGEAFAASVINAVIHGPAWDKTLLVWTYDEHGGYYDHVPPPAAVAPDSIAPQVPSGQSAYDGFARLGFRVPFALVSPPPRLACGVRPHQHPQAGRDQVEPARADLPGRERERAARHAGLPQAVVRRAAGARPAGRGHEPRRAGLQRQRPRHDPAGRLGH